MDFTAAFRHASSKCIEFSPGSTFIASISGEGSDTLLVRASSTLQVIRTWTFHSCIHEIEWSQDGAFILASHRGQQEDGVVFVVSLDPSKEANDDSDDAGGWVARVASGSEGLAHATWTPPYGPRTLVTFSQDQLKASLYNLSDQTISSIEAPKRDKLIWSPKRPDQFAAILKGAERDSMHIFACKRFTFGDLKGKKMPLSQESWKSEISFLLSLNDAHDALWAPDAHCLAVWEGPLEYKLQLYTPDGRIRTTFLIEPESDGKPVFVSGAGLETRTSTRIATRKPKSDVFELPHVVAGGGLGIRQVKWHPMSRYLSIGGWDEKLRILSSSKWTEVSCFDTSARAIQTTPSNVDMSVYGALVAWREPANWLEETRARGIVALEPASLPVSPTVLKVDYSKPNATFGIKWTSWSPQGNLIAVYNERLPFTVFVYAFTQPGEDGRQLESPYLLTVLQLNSAIRTICWKPSHTGKLGIVCDNQAVYTWELLPHKSEDGHTYRQRAEAIPIPIEAFRAVDIRWSLDGQKILLASEDTFCCAFEAV